MDYLHFDRRKTCIPPWRRLWKTATPLLTYSQSKKKKLREVKLWPLRSIQHV